MGHRYTKVTPITDDGVYDKHLSISHQPGTNRAVQHLHPCDETPVRAERGGGDRRGVCGGEELEEKGGGGEERGDRELKEASRVQEKRKRGKWWRRLISILTPAKKPLPESPSCQQCNEGEQMKVAWARKSSDDYIFSHYTIGDKLGKGGFGVVYEGKRLEDGLKVAVKYVTKGQDTECISIPDHPNPLPKEIALTILANKGPSDPHIIKLLDWQDHEDHYVLILECPSPCENLEEFLYHRGGTLDENTTRHIMEQAIHAADLCCQRGVFHRDVKLENLLINKETSEVKLIDFGCADILKKSSYKTYDGTDAYAPPEYKLKGKYYGKPATVFSLGMVMFALLCGHFPTHYDIFQLKYKRYTYIQPSRSKDCCGLLRELLNPHYSERISLSQILSHNWFKVYI
ncbi:serine/threonine-protein kinase pim-2 [Danio rerio]|uniref:non-specific serine/threonine protein kinase n=1 Tax=Danio rerio TaxID=7955 RepID=A0AB32TIE4_DANRE